MHKFALGLYLILLSNCSAQVVRHTPTKKRPLTSLQPTFQKGADSLPLAIYWYWLSDQVSKEGVVKDLEAMKKAGINRAFIGNIDNGPPYGKHKFFSEAWWDIMHTALKKAGELNIEIGLFNSPGWSQSGGPWVKPSQSMRYLSTAEIVVTGPVKFNSQLPTVGENGQDVKVLAYPVPEIPETATWSLTKADKAESVLDMNVSGQRPMRSLAIAVDRKVKTSAVLYYKKGDTFQELTRLLIDRSNTSLSVGFDPLAPVVVSLPEVKSSAYRLVIAPAGEARITVTVSSAPRVERYPEKTLAKMFQTPLPLWSDYQWERQSPVTDPKAMVAPKTVKDITAFTHNGKLTWDVPPGQWKITRLSMLSTKVTNAPASPEATGLEVDKMSKPHAAAHFRAYMGEILRRIPAQDRRTFKVVVQDSYETGGQNWTDDMEARFTQSYGYSPVPYLPVLSGTVVGSQDQSDRFLWDLRRLVADRVAYDYVGGMRDESHKHGLTTWLENYGHWGFPGEFLQYGGQSDEIGGEFWNEGDLGNIENRAASSSAHIYGKQKVWAESFTASGSAFSRYPYLMKRRSDRFFTEGINSTLLHVYIHQPYEDRWPGVNAWFGSEFNRKNTWFNQLDEFTRYLKRIGFLLQQGQYVADVAYFIGEDAPKMTGVCDPALPKGYSFDYINAEVLLHQASVKQGMLTLASGMQYKVLVLPKLATMRPELLRKLSAFVEQGLTIIGPAPQYSPSLTNYPQADREVKQLAQTLWQNVTPDGHQKRGKGYVFGEKNTLETIFTTLAMIPDFTLSTDSASVLFIHRAHADGDVYFLSNQQEKKVSFDASFRQGRGTPQLWDPLTGEIRHLPNFTRQQHATLVPLELEANGSAFIVFTPSNEVVALNPKAENFPTGTSPLTLKNPWKITFNEFNGRSFTHVANQLFDWKDASDSTIRYFSGTAQYVTTFTVGSAPQQPQYLDLGNVMAMGKVFLNEQYVGGVWTYPYRLNITNFLQKGENTLRIEVSNTWVNQLIGDQHLPAKEQKLSITVNPWKASSPLQPSGLIGPVMIYSLNYLPVKK